MKILLIMDKKQLAKLW